MRVLSHRRRAAPRPSGGLSRTQSHTAAGSESESDSGSGSDTDDDLAGCDVLALPSVQSAYGDAAWVSADGPQRLGGAAVSSGRWRAAIEAYR